LPRTKLHDMTASIGDLALMGGVSTPTMREYVTKGQFEAVAPGRYPLVACMQVYTKSLRTQASGRPPDAARTELAKAQAAIAVAKAGVLNRKLIEVEDVEQEYRGKVRQLRATILALPNRIAGMVPTLGREGAAIIVREVRELVTEVANVEPAREGADGEDMAGGVQSAAATRLERVDRDKPLPPERSKRAPRPR